MARAQILPPTPENISLAADSICRGDVVGMPTETVYGLAGDCRNPLAVARIFETKERPTFDPLIVHVGISARSIRELDRLKLIDASKISAVIQKQVDALIQSFWPGPLTIVLPRHPDISDLVTSGLPSVALRMPRHPIAQALIAASQTPLAAPSANRFGRISPTTAQAVFEELGDRIDFILDGGPCQIGVESTVVSFDSLGKLWVLRHGGTAPEAIQKTLGTTQEEIQTPSSFSEPGKATSSPGMLEAHYAPKKQLHILPKPVLELEKSDLSVILPFIGKVPSTAAVGVLLMSGDIQAAALRISELIQHPVIVRSLSPTPNLPEAARHLFAEMRFLDSSDAAVLLSEPCLSQFGLGYAISDRLKRASTR